MAKKLNELEIEVYTFKYINNLIDYLDKNTDLDSNEIFAVIKTSLTKHEIIQTEVEDAVNNNKNIIDLIHRVGKRINEVRSQ